MATTKTYFATSKEAWAFMRRCDEAGISAGFPSLKPEADKGYSVQHKDAEASPCGSCGACDDCWHEF